MHPVYTYYFSCMLQIIMQRQLMYCTESEAEPLQSIYVSPETVYYITRNLYLTSSSRYKNYPRTGIHIHRKLNSIVLHVSVYVVSLMASNTSACYYVMHLMYYHRTRIESVSPCSTYDSWYLYSYTDRSHDKGLGKGGGQGRLKPPPPDFKLMLLCVQTVITKGHPKCIIEKQERKYQYGM